jgi:hypothetical protein
MFKTGYSLGQYVLKTRVWALSHECRNSRYGLGTRYRKILTRAMLGVEILPSQSSYLTKHNS